MKHLFFFTLLFFTACASTLPVAASERLSIKVVNNSLLPHKYTFIGYEPGQTGNWTKGMVLLPGATHTFKLPVGTKVYQATSAQVDVVMGGRNIRGDDPLFTVLSGDDGKTIRLR